ncbi:hypothetical protein L2K70_18845 [Nocardioides KLBMP 9356]|uniref:Blue (type 1) copper domain-containing protein n=1 Tax=Nocardioides potassii TaxID=2911371 RepID=A0ABS9HGI6_9ACTN|nr:hypothetical protein [Nocardioides potassii]MCF6379674.1 hypothetical protein [Nocardioides potassii]
MGAAALVCSPLLLAPGTANAKPVSVSSRAATPMLTATLTGKTIKVSGPSKLRPGRVRMSVSGKGVVELAMFRSGYDAADFAADVNKFGAKNDVKALKHALANTTILGGFEGGGSGTLVLPKAGSYTPFSLGDKGVVLGDPIMVKGAKRKSATPSTDGRIIAKAGLSWGGSSTLPAKGRLLFKNRGNTGVPHFIAMQQVQEGTTTDQVLEYFQSGDQGQPSWGLPAGLETGSISPGKSVTVNYDLPPGQYVVMCFFPDPTMGGMPHAFMGMLEMIHLT